MIWTLTPCPTWHAKRISRLGRDRGRPARAGAGGGVWALLITLFLPAPPGSAQSLAELARREEARRQAVSAPAPKYTNADLRGGPRLTAGRVEPTGEATAAGPSDPAVGPSEASDIGSDPTPPAEPPQREGEAEWRRRITEAREQLARRELLREALQNRVDGLWAQFTAIDDPLLRAQVADERDRALEELDLIEMEVEADRQRITDIEAAARRSAVPPGWLR